MNLIKIYVEINQISVMVKLKKVKYVWKPTFIWLPNVGYSDSQLTCKFSNNNAPVSREQWFCLYINGFNGTKNKNDLTFV